MSSLDTDTTSQSKKPSHHIGIGASAGGLEALQEFFTGVPADTGAAFIIVQHLSPDFKSMMPELLSKTTDMPIYQVIDGIPVESNCIYLMPPRINMMAAEGKLLLSEQMPDSHVHMPIDIFFRSLAEDQQHHAIGVILSGTGSDGTRGVKAIKETGGLVVIQDPQSAKFDGMPVSAINTGLADIVLPSKEIGQHLVKFINHPFISGDSPSLKYSIGESGDTFAEIFRLLKTQSSINFTQYKASTVARRIERRLGINQLTSLDSYLRLLMESPKEVQILSRELLIGVTRFFRDEEAYAKLVSEVIPKIVSKSNSREGIRLWVAGCSTGEEAYSMAILLDEAMKQKGCTGKVKIFATDVDENAIAHASAGVYSADIVQDISPERMEMYFEDSNERHVVSPYLRKMVLFASHNMIDDPPFSNIDLVTCRNVLIYFQHAAQKKVLSSLYFALQRDGFLFLGSSESLGDLQTHFEVIDERSRIFKKISNLRIPMGHAPPLRELSAARYSSMSTPPIASLNRPARPNTRGHLSSVLERMIEEYAPDSIVLNEDFEAMHVYGDVSRYTKGVRPGRISNSIKDMVADDLSVAISTALHRCEKSQGDVFYKDISLNLSPSEQIIIDLSIFYVKEGESSASPFYYVVQFIENVDVDESLIKRPKIAFDATEQSRQRINDLEQELVKKQEHLQITIEELETTNEELQSANEELMSANEELQSTNEELQSVNEELYTVNSEYQEKIMELTESNADLDSVITSTDIGIVFLDEQLTIRKFTPSAVRYINMLNSDIGRPFHHISHELIYDDLLVDIASVSSSSDLIEKEISSNQDQSLLIRITPYRKKFARKIETGVLLTITNISRLRFVENALQKAQDQLRSSVFSQSERLHRRIVNAADVKILLLDDDVVDRKRVSKLLTAVPDREFNIVSCSEVEEALDSAMKNKFDICLVDYQLGGCTAKDFTEQLKTKEVDLPIVILSGYSEAGLDAEFLNTDIFDFLNKDELSSQLLVRSIDYVLERREVQGVFDGLTSKNQEV